MLMTFDRQVVLDRERLGRLLDLLQQSRLFGERIDRRVFSFADKMKVSNFVDVVTVVEEEVDDHV